jgi:hypothetical protein
LLYRFKLGKRQHYHCGTRDSPALLKPGIDSGHAGDPADTIFSHNVMA